MIYPGAVWRPGVNAGYASGRAAMTAVVCHYTVGKQSDPIGARGYFNFLVRRNGEIVQFAEADAVTWHAGNWNTRGPGIEVEYLDEPDIFTPEAHQATAGLVEWLISLGVPDQFYDGPRIADHHGFITHRSLIQTGDAHHDYWPDLPRLAPPPAPTQEQPMFFISDGTRNAAVTEYSFFQVGPLNGLGFATVDAGTFNEIKRLTDEKRKTL